MPCRVAICDDDKNQLNSLQSVIEKWGRISGSPCEVSVFPSAEAFLFAYEEDKHWDILLLDVEMEGMSGMGLARRVRQDNLRSFLSPPILSLSVRAMRWTPCII